MSLAWHVVALDRQKKLPTLKSLMSAATLKPESQVQTVTQQKAMVQMISEKYGLKVRKVAKVG